MPVNHALAPGGWIRLDSLKQWLAARVQAAPSSRETKEQMGSGGTDAVEYIALFDFLANLNFYVGELEIMWSMNMALPSKGIPSAIIAVPFATAKTALDGKGVPAAA